MASIQRPPAVGTGSARQKMIGGLTRLHRWGPLMAAAATQRDPAAAPRLPSPSWLPAAVLNEACTCSLQLACSHCRASPAHARPRLNGRVRQQANVRLMPRAARTRGGRDRDETPDAIDAPPAPKHEDADEPELLLLSPAQPGAVGQPAGVADDAADPRKAMRANRWAAMQAMRQRPVLPLPAAAAAVLPASPRPSSEPRSPPALGQGGPASPEATAVPLPPPP